MRSRLVFLAALAAVVAACSTPTAPPDSSDSVRATGRPSLDEVRTDTTGRGGLGSGTGT
jgi:hypothetical protein